MRNLDRSRIQFVIPYAGRLLYSNISKEDYALCYLINLGYIESLEIEKLLWFAESVKKHVSKEETVQFQTIGNLDTVVMKDNTYRYRLRYHFTSLNRLYALLHHLQIPLVIAKSFHIGISQMSNCLDAVPFLELYRGRKIKFQYTLDHWLTDCCMIQLYIAAEINKVQISLPKRLSQMLRHGMLDRAPYLCGSYQKEHHISSIIVPPEKYLELQDEYGNRVDILNDILEELHQTERHDYVLVSRGTEVPLYGFTRRNVLSDTKIKGGVYAWR